MNYQQTLDWLFKQLPMYQRVGPIAFKKDLGNIIALCDHLGNPHEQFRSIHIAGTNGKGSVAHILAGVLQNYGYKIGLYTSPHYKDFRERIKINGVYISEEKVIAFVSDNMKLFEEIKPSFFEMTVAMAFDHFRNEQVDFAIVETGLGGRLDSTNIVTPILSVITNIGYDHQQFLGDTLPEIAGEKAGIIKKDIPVVIGEYQEEIEHVFREKAAEMNADLTYADDIAQVILNKFSPEGLNINTNISEDFYFENIQTDIHGKYQRKNLTTVFACLFCCYQQKIIDINTLSTKLTNVSSLSRFLGRWMILQDRPQIIADSAHNKEGLTEALLNLGHINYNQLHIVLGMVSDKDHNEYLGLLPKDATYYIAKPTVPRGYDAGELKSKASALGLQGTDYISAKVALATAKEKAANNDLILIIGSVFLVAEVI